MNNLKDLYWDMKWEYDDLEWNVIGINNMREN